MIPQQFFYLMVVLGFLWIFFMLHVAWPSQCPATPRRLVEPILPPHKRSNEPKSFAGLIHKPLCDACEHAAEARPQAPAAPPPLLTFTRGRPRTIDSQQQFCPDQDCSYYGWTGRGNLRANGHPGGQPWRQFQCVSCHGYFQETHGTLLHGKRVAVDLIVRVIACLAEGLGIRGTARVFEVDPNTVLQWLVEAAEQLRAFSRPILHDVRVRQVQMDELFALLSAVRAGTVSEAEAIERLERSPQWVWAAMDPESKLLLAIDVGNRTLAMAQRVVHTDGFREYLTALLTHYGHWVQPPRRQGKGPTPKPRWMPLPQLLYAQVVKTVRRRRLVHVRHRVVFGTLEAVQQVLAACGWQSNTAFIERLNLSIRQHVAAIGRRVSTLCKGEDGLRQQLALYHVYYNFCLPHAS